MKYGQELIEQLQKENELMQSAIDRRWERINNWETDMEDCFISQRCEERGIRNNSDKIELIRNGGCAWFCEYATLDGQIVDAHWCNTKYGSKLRVKMPDGSVVWTTADTQKGLAKKGLKRVECFRPAWYAFKSPYRGMLGVYSGDYVLFPSDVNYATGEDATTEPLAVRDYDYEAERKARKAEQEKIRAREARFAAEEAERELQEAFNMLYEMDGEAQ